MPSEMTHGQWVARTRQIERNQRKMRDLLFDVRADLMSQVRRIDRALNYSTHKTSDQKEI